MMICLLTLLAWTEMSFSKLTIKNLLKKCWALQSIQVLNPRRQSHHKLLSLVASRSSKNKFLLLHRQTRRKNHKRQAQSKKNQILWKPRPKQSLRTRIYASWLTFYFWKTLKFQRENGTSCLLLICSSRKDCRNRI